MKILKLTGIFLGFLFLTVILIVIFGITFVNPAHFKSLITAAVMKHIDRKVSINGNLSWTIFPHLGIKIDQIILSNQNGFQQPFFAKIDHAVMTVKISPLIHGKIESSGIKLDGMRLYLIKNSTGAINWQFKSHSTPSVNKAATVASSVQGHALPLAIFISSFDITNAEISWIDEQKKQIVTFDHVALHANDINLSQSFPIKASFHFVSNQPAVEGQTDISSLFLPDVNRQIYTFKETHLSADLKDNNKSSHFNATGDMVVTMSDSLMIQGNLKSDAIETNAIKMTNVIAPIDYEKGILKLASTANFYQGQLQTDAKINFNKQSPDILIHLKLTQIDAASLLQALGQKKLNFEGLGNLDLQLSSIGSTHQAFMENLNGVARFNVNKGSLKGIDIAYLIEKARGFFQMQNQPVSDQHQTEFGNFTGTAMIQHGVLTINDLLVESKSFTTTGRGRIDLINHEIDYGLQTVVLSDPENQTDPLYGIALPIKIKGQLRNPSIRLDLAALAEMQVTRQIKKMHAHKHKNNIRDQLRKSIPEEANALLKNIFGE